MLINDPIGDLLTRIRNIVMAGKTEITVPTSRLKEDVCKVLQKEGYLSEVKTVKGDLVLTLATSHRKPVLTGIKSISKPGLRIYRKADELPFPLRGAGIAIISTPEGVMTSAEAKKKRLGGEVLGEAW
jgi:small subunit ribosomal protein S8